MKIILVGIIIGSLGFLPALSKTNLYENEKNVQQLTLLNWKEWQIYSEKNILIISFNKPNNGACKSFAPEYVKAAKAFENCSFVKFMWLNKEGQDKRLADALAVKGVPSIGTLWAGVRTIPQRVKNAAQVIQLVGNIVTQTGLVKAGIIKVPRRGTDKTIAIATTKEHTPHHSTTVGNTVHTTAHPTHNTKSASGTEKTTHLTTLDATTTHDPTTHSATTAHETTTALSEKTTTEATA